MKYKKHTSGLEVYEILKNNGEGPFPKEIDLVFISYEDKVPQRAFFKYSKKPKEDFRCKLEDINKLEELVSFFNNPEKINEIE